jgi:uncharacterized protein
MEVTTQIGTLHLIMSASAYDFALENALKPIATCSYAVIWLQRHPEYQGEISKDYCEGNSCAL